jgi:hypothetical protein
MERQAKRYEQERDQWESKFEVRSLIILGCRKTIGHHELNTPCPQEAQGKYRKAQAELDDLVANMDNL